MKRLAIICAFIVIAISVSLRAESLASSRTITEHLIVWVPLPPCGVPAIAVRISETAGIPAGIEFIPGCRQTEPPRPRNAEEMSFLGLTAEEALDRLIAMDPRYHWVETGGVILVRPLEAWQDQHHFMNATISEFGFTDQNVTGASVMLGAAIHGRPVAPPAIETPLSTAQGNQHFSVRPRTTSILEAANAVVRAHGSLHWILTYCKPERRPEYAWLMLATFDHSGSGSGPVPAIDQNGRRYNACSPSTGRR
jgi:hypothetical protein